MRIIATKSIELNGIIHTPDTEFDVDDVEGKKLVKSGKARRKDGLVEVDHEDGKAGQ